MSSSFKRIFLFAVHCVMITTLFLVARGTWRAYSEEKLIARFSAEAIPAAVRVSMVSDEKKNWKDYITNCKYIRFTYRDKPYTVRYILDSGWIGAGNTVHLLYFPTPDLFRQPSQLKHPDPVIKKSPLVGWIVVSTFSYANRWLFFTVLLATAIVVLGLSALGRLTGLAFFDSIATGIFILAGVTGACFVSWDLWSNYGYCREIRAPGTQRTVQVIATDRYLMDRDYNHDRLIVSYYYTATVHFNGADRMIAISSDDYDRLRPHDTLTVWYNEQKDDMMSVDYTVEKGKWLFPFLLWLLVGFALWKKWFRKRQNARLARE